MRAKGVLVQTRRHTFICSLFGIRHVVVAVNKMDLVKFEKETFDRIVADYTAFASELGFSSIVPIPISARHGDNIIARSPNTHWYRGPCLLDCLETVDIEAIEGPFRFHVQWVNRPNLGFSRLCRHRRVRQHWSWRRSRRGRVRPCIAG